MLVIASKKDQHRKALLRRGAYMLTVHVINTQTGARSSYQARREDVQASSFTTVDGRKVYVAGIERIEVESP